MWAAITAWLSAEGLELVKWGIGLGIAAIIRYIELKKAQNEYDAHIIAARAAVDAATTKEEKERAWAAHDALVNARR